MNEQQFTQYVHNTFFQLNLINLSLVIDHFWSLVTFLRFEDKKVGIY